MAEITRRRIGELLRKVFEILLDQPEGLQAKEVVRQLEKSMTLSEFEKSSFPKWPNVRRFDKIVRFATVGTVKAGWLIKSKGKWSLTEQGRKAFREINDPERFEREVHRLYWAWKATQPKDEGESAVEIAASAQGTLEEAEENAWIEIQDYLQELNPYDFQQLVAALLRAMGYFVSWVSPPGRDGGIDVLAHVDPLGISDPRIKVQVKRRTDKIGVEGLRSFMALLGDQDVGIYISTGGFTSDAESEARTQEKRKITLVDLEKLFDLWVENSSKVPEAERRLLPLKPIHYLEPEK